MKPLFMIGAVIGSGALIGTAAAYGGAAKLFNRVIPRQDQLRVDMNEMADAEKWEEYKKIIYPRKEWLLKQNLELISINAKDGIKLKGYYLPAEKSSDKLIIFCHGYTSQGLSNFSALSEFYYNLGFDCLILDLRAHGESEGDYVGFGILDRFDCLEWIKYINKRFNGKKRILLHGISMGATTVLMTSGFEDLPENVKGIVADCAFTSPYDVFAHVLKRDYKLPPFPIMNINDKMCRDKAGYGFQDYSTITAVKNTKCPILFIHGEEDNFVPTWMSQKNYEACNSQKKLLIVKNAGHGASYYENQSQYESAVSEFINEWMP